MNKRGKKTKAFDDDDACCCDVLDYAYSGILSREIHAKLTGCWRVAALGWVAAGLLTGVAACLLWIAGRRWLLAVAGGRRLPVATGGRLSVGSRRRLTVARVRHVDS